MHLAAEASDKFPGGEIRYDMSYRNVCSLKMKLFYRSETNKYIASGYDISYSYV
jgi:hypothetical protein